MSDKINVLNISLCNISKEDLLHKMNKGVLFTPNVDQLVKLQKNEQFYHAYNDADWVVCDSRIVALFLKFLGCPIKQVIPGSSFFPQYCDYHKTNEDIRIFLLGAGPGIAERAMKNINKRIGRPIIVEALSPSYGFEKNEQECEMIVNRINQSKATVLVVGVGAPKQEIWIHAHQNKLTNIKLSMALGATIDFEAGVIDRAPSIFQKLHLEWLFRLIKEPKRLWKRYLIDDLPFFYHIIRWKIGFYKDPFKKK